MIVALYLLLVLFFAIYPSRYGPEDWASAIGRGLMVGFLLYLGFGVVMACLGALGVVWLWYPRG